MLTVLLAVCAAIMSYAAFMLTRNNAVYHVRIAMLHRPDWEADYRALPSYDAMLYSPRYWLLWSTHDWLDWIERHKRKAG